MAANKINPKFQTNIQQGLLENGSSLLEQGQVGQAVQVLQVYVASNPNNPTAQLQLAQAYLLRKQPNDIEKAVNHARIGVSNCGMEQQVQGCLVLGVSLMFLERLESDSQVKRNLRQEAVQVLTKGVAIDSKDVGCQYHLALLYAEEMDLDKALQHVRKAMEVSQGQHLKSWALLANILTAKNQLSKALQILEGQLSSQKIPQLADDEILLYRLKSRILQHLNRGKEAVGVLESLTDKLPNSQQCNLASKMDVYHDLCIMYISQDKIFDGEQWVDEANKLCPNCSRVYLMRGAVFSAIGQQEKAMGAWETAVAIDPSNVEASLKLGEGHMKVGGGGRAHMIFACELLQEAIRKRSDLREAWYNLGLVQSQMGMQKQAEHSLRQAVLLGETAPILSFTSLPIECYTQRSEGIQ